MTPANPSNAIDEGSGTAVKFSVTPLVLELQVKKPFVTSGAAPAKVMLPKTLPGAAKVPVKTFQLWLVFQKDASIALEMLRTEVAPLLIESPDPPETATVSKPVVVLTKSHEKVEPESNARPPLNASEPAPDTPGLNVPPFWITTELPNEPRPVSEDPAPETAVDPLTVTPEATSTRPPPENDTVDAPTLLLRRTTPVASEFVICKFPPPVMAPTFSVAAAEFEIATFPDVLEMLPMVVTPVPEFEIDTPAALEIPLVESVPVPALVSVSTPAAFVRVPVNEVAPVPPTETVDPETVAFPIVTFPVAFEFVMAKPALLVKDPVKAIAPVPDFEIVRADAAVLLTLPPN